MTTTDHDETHDRNRGRSRGAPAFGTLSLRPRTSAGDRGPRTDLVPLQGEILERGEDYVIGTIPRQPFRGDDLFLDERPYRVTVEHHHHGEPVAEPRRVRWALLGAYVFGIAMLLLALFVLVQGGVIDVGSHVPWQGGGR